MKIGKKGKRFFALLLSVALLVATMPVGVLTVSAAASASGTCGDNLTWTLTGSVLTISGTGAMDDYNSVAAPWYSSRGFITTVVIGDSVTTIGAAAFNYCTGLTSITIPDGVTSIGEWAFSDCESLVSVNMGNGVTDVGEHAFWSCRKLEEVNLGKNVRTIGDVAFQNCVSLKSIVLPDSVETIGSWVFTNCTNLKSITIGKGLQAIGSYAFDACNNLEAVYISDLAAWCRINFSNANPFDYADKFYLNNELVTELIIPEGVETITGNHFSGCTSITKITIPDSVISIGYRAFEDCCNLQSVTIGDGVTTIGSSAFSGCGSLTGIIIPDSVTSIDSSAFAGCSSLQSIIIPDSVATIGSSAFSGCGSLTSIIIPDSVTFIGDYAFSDCNNLTDVYYSGSTDQWEQISIGSNNTALTNATLHIVESMTVASSSCGDNLTWTLYHTGTLVISGTGSMYDYNYGTAPWYNNCDSITTVVIGDGVTSIGDCAFYDCNLKGITIPNSIASIGDEAFYCCSELTSITIPDSVTFIGDYAFSDCNNLTGIWVDENNTVYSSDSSGVLFNKEKTKLIQAPCAISGDYTIPDSVTNIGERAFSGCTGLTSITIPDSVTTIGAYAFAGCDSLTDVYYSGSTNQWDQISIGSDNTALTNATLHIVVNSGVCGDHLTWMLDDTGTLTISGTGSMYDYNYAITPWYSNRSSITTVVIGDGVTTIGVYAFGACYSLESVTIPGSVTSIGYDAFGGCIGLTSITIPDSVTSISENAFAGCTGLTSITIPGSVTSIDYSVFTACSSLTGIWVDENNTVYSSDSSGVLFNKEKTKLIQAPGAISGDYTIPDSVTNIGERAFSGCTGLTSITIPDSVTTIGGYAFGNCLKLTTVWFGGSESDRDRIFTDSNSWLLESVVWHYNTCDSEAHTYSGDCDDSCNNCDWTRAVNTLHSFDNGADTNCNTCEYIRVLKSISIESTPEKLTYLESKDLLDVTGGKITLFYTDNTTGTIDMTANMITGFDNTKIGTQTLTVTHGNFSDTYDVEIIAKSLTSIAVTTNPTKLTYIEGTELDDTGMVLTVYYNNDTSETVTTGWVSEYDFSMVGTATVKVTYGGKSCTYDVTVIEKTLTHIAIESEPSQREYLEGDAVLDTDGLAIHAYYDNDTDEIVTGNYTVTGYDPTPGTKTITVTYGEKTATFTVTVKAKSVTSIAVTKKPNKLTYLDGDSFDKTGMVVTAYYDNNTSAEVTDYTISGYSSTVGTKTITVTYEGKTATFTVTVNSRVPSAITSSKYTVSANNISKITAGTTVSTLLAGLNEGSYCKVYNANSVVSGSTAVGTGMVVKIMDGNTVKASYTVIVTGDTNGDGNITVTDMIAIKAHVLKKTLLSGAAATAADTNGDGSISITDFIQVKAKILDKGTITAR